MSGNINTSLSTIEKQSELQVPLTRKQKLADFFKTKTFHYTIIGIVFTDLTLLLIGLVLAIYRTPEALLANFILFLFSWVFPAIFFVEIGLKMWTAGGWKKYFDTRLKKWDAGILVFSVVSDIMLYVLLMEHASATATAVVIFRLWKIARLFHAYSHLIQIENESIKKQFIEANMFLEDENTMLKEENRRLQSQLDDYKSSVNPQPMDIKNLK